MTLKRLLNSLLLGCLISLSANAQVDEMHIRLTNLPHVYINTFTDKNITSKTTYVLARMWYVDEQDSVVFYDSLEIRGRGNSTWNLAKKPYKLKFHKKEKLLGKGRPNTKKWTLLANHGDKTLMRNALTSLVGERLGLKFNPAAKFIDLTLNGNYIGNYQISDHIDVRPHRVNITEQDVPLTDESNITGGYLLEADGFFDFQNGVTGFYTPHSNVPIRIHYPDEDDIETQQYKYIRDAVYDLEKRLFSDNFTDPLEGYRCRIDSTSLANWYLATEVSGNVDGFFSAYFYKEQDDDYFYWGPLWDYDIAYANDSRKGDTSRQLMRDVAFGANMRTWIERIWQDPWFTALISRRYAQAVSDELETFMLEKIDSISQLLQRSQELNFALWGINKQALRERVLYSTYDQYVQDLRNYVKRHIPYIQEVLAEYLPDEPTPPEPPQPKIPDFPADTLFYYAIANAGPGTVFDIDAANNTVCANAFDEDSQSQQWHIRPLSNGYMHIVNRLSGLALTDPTEGAPTATTLIGTQLAVTESDSLDIRQQWDIVAQSDERYNLINHFSLHGANLSGGSGSNGTRIISYTSDGRDASSKNRQWTLTPVAEVEQEEKPDGIENIYTNGHESNEERANGECDYALAYDPTGDRLHFGASDPSQLTFTVRLYDRSGRLLRTFRASDECSLLGLPRGLYIVSWHFDGRQHSVKFTK